MVAKTFAGAANGLTVLDPNALPAGPAKDKLFGEIYRIFGARYPELADLVRFESENHYENGSVRVVVDQKGKAHALTSFVPLPEAHTTALTYFFAVPKAATGAIDLLAAEARTVMAAHDASVPIFELQRPGTSEPAYAKRDAEDRAVAARHFDVQRVPMAYNQTTSEELKVVLSDIELNAAFPPDLSAKAKNRLLADHMVAFRKLDDPTLADPDNRAELAANLQAIENLTWTASPAGPDFQP